MIWTKLTEASSPPILPYYSGDMLRYTIDLALALTKELVEIHRAIQAAETQDATVVTNTYTIAQKDETIICNRPTAFTVTLPVAVIGKVFIVKNIGAGTVTIDGYDDDTIDGEWTQTIIQWESAQLQCYAVNAWVVI
jgi:archaellum component FlaG (FlaF/FlaG flagellin family)